METSLAWARPRPHAVAWGTLGGPWLLSPVQMVGKHQKRIIFHDMEPDVFLCAVPGDFLCAVRGDVQSWVMVTVCGLKA